MLFTTLLTTYLTLASPPDSVQQRRFSLFPLPLVYYTPETRLAYGAAAVATFRFRRDSLTTARPSQVTFGAAYTQNRQLLFYLPFQIFYDHNRYFLNGEAGYYRYNYYFFGLGQREVPRELYGVNFPRIRVNAFRRVAYWTGQRSGAAPRQLYAGLRYQYEDFRVTDVAPEGLLATGTVPGGRGSRLGGPGAGLLLDTRDNVFFPTRGLLADVTGLVQRWHPSGQPAEATTFRRYVVDVASYQALGSPKAVLALNYVVSLTAGTAPFNALSLLGGTKRLRGYYEGHFRDQNLALLQSELRFALWQRLGGVVFGGVGLLGDAQTILRPTDPKWAYGAGLRFTINRRDHLNVRLDYGLGRQSSGVYLTIGEAF